MITTLGLGGLLLLFACSTPESNAPEPPGFAAAAPFFFLDSLRVTRFPELGRLAALAARYADPAIGDASDITGPWHFGLGHPAHGLRAGYDRRPAFDTLVELPHRINRPDWPFWYERTILIEEDSYLLADGDDGVQCFLDGRRLTPQLGTFFHLAPSPDSISITLRVLNNALQGGLRRVRLVPATRFAQYRRERRLDHLARQLLFLAQRDAQRFTAADWAELGEVLSSEDPDRLADQLAEFSALQPTRLPVLPLDSAETDTAFSFTAWGDSQGGWATFVELTQQMTGGGDVFSIGLGDLVAEGCDERQWQAFAQCLQPLLAEHPVFPIVGNHDYDGYYNDLTPLRYRQVVLGDTTRPAYFAWTYGGASFLALDPNEAFPLGITGTQRAWLFDQLDSPGWRAATWRFLLIHQPPYAQGWPGYHGDDFIRQIVDSLAEAKQIDFVLSGHAHDYERLTKTYGTQRTHFFVLGGAGGGLEPPASSAYPRMDTIVKQHHFARFAITPRAVRISVYGLAGELLDQYQVVR
jgi:hypothetical protein